MSAAVIAIVAGLTLAGLTGWLLTRRSGVLQETGSASGQALDVDTSDLGIADSGPTVVHFSAPWCGPCVGVRRVVDQVCTDLGGVAHVEIDIDTNPTAARKLSVLSLPTTLIFDAHGRQRYRATGVPAAADLRSALEPLLA
ncbi:MAG TPA: thioredoxin family protein [Mycobacterium sp.]|nr:thioredoxin family protein [Mycobacterium sp.]